MIEITNYEKQAAKETAKELVLEGASSFFPGAGLLYNLGVRINDLIGRRTIILSTRTSIYEKGAEMLSRAKKSVVSISTLSGEKPTLGVDISDQYQNTYLIALNRVSRDQTIKFTRHTRLDEPERRIEALNFLLYGKENVIIQSNLPIEFLVVDETEFLIGFPLEGELNFAYYQKDPNLASHLTKWAEACSIKSSGVSSQDIIKQYCKSSGSYSCTHDDCLCRLIDGFEHVESVAKNNQDTFDYISEFYDEVYSHIKAEDYYPVLSRQLKLLLKDSFPANKKPYKFLDCGCGRSFGGDEWIDAGWDYYGFDLSEKMIDRCSAKLKKETCVEQSHFIDYLSSICERNKTPNGRCAIKPIHVIAWQGNSFDCLLGEWEKRQALFLMDKLLPSGGMLLFTGSTYEDQQTQIKRIHRRGTVKEEVIIPLTWSGRYVRQELMKEHKPILHPTGLQWLNKQLIRMNYEEITIPLPKSAWFGPQGGPPYELIVFRKVENNA